MSKHDLNIALIKNIFFSVLLCWTILYPLFKIPFFITYKSTKDNYNAEIESTEKLIATIDKAVAQGSKEKI